MSNAADAARFQVALFYLVALVDGHVDELDLSAMGRYDLEKARSLLSDCVGR